VGGDLTFLRFYFVMMCMCTEHQNFFGVDDNLGPVAVSLRREKIPDSGTATGKSDSTAGWLYQYRIIVRTSEVSSLTASFVLYSTRLGFKTQCFKTKTKLQNKDQVRDLRHQDQDFSVQDQDQASRRRLSSRP